MRSTQELIAELEEEAAKHWRAAIVVHMGLTTLVHADNPDRHKVLAVLLEAGGEPMGMMLADKVDAGALTRPVVYKGFPEPLNVQVQAERFVREVENLEMNLEIAQQLIDEYQAGKKE